LRNLFLSQARHHPDAVNARWVVPKVGNRDPELRVEMDFPAI
jgi:hypothetical protein